MELVESKKYKKTDLGIIPWDWEVMSLSELAHIIGGGTPSTFVSIYWNGDVNWFTPTEIGYSKYITESVRKITKEGLANCSARVLPKGTILLTTRAGIGDLAILTIEASTNQGFQNLIAKEGYSNEFLYYLLAIKKNELIQNASGSTFLEISPNKVKSIKVAVPTLPEQISIAKALSDADEMIAGLQKLIAKKKLIKQGAMQELLKPKKGWEVKKLNDVCWFQEGPGLRNWQFTKSGMKVINVTNLENGVLNLERTTRHISLDEFHKMYEHFEINEHDILVASSGNSYGKVAVVRKQDLPLVMNTSVIRFKPLKNLDYKFLLIFLKSQQFKKQIDLLITGGAQPNFGPVHLNKTLINLPIQITEQNRIATILSDMEIEINSIESKLEKCRKVKQGMMQNLLTGKIRLV
jgi:type I restriction enzyme S subunit